MNYFDRTYYDTKYSETDEYGLHYQDVRYYPIWKEVMGNLTVEEKILDLGCGPAHLGQMLIDNGFKHYTGIDFSSLAVKMAKEKLPNSEIIEADLLNEVSYSRFSEHTIVAIEVFEHIEDDIQLVKMLPKNKIIFSVPNFIASNHYRTYKNEEFIKDYYKDVIDIESIKKFGVATTKGSFIYVCKGEII